MGHENSNKIVGVYWDFENIHASLCERVHGPGSWREHRNYKAEWLVDVKAIMSYVASIGTVAINRAYNNWQHFFCYRHDFHEHSIDLIQLFPRGMKNGADIRLVLDVVEDQQHYPHITHAVVIGGDSDYISLAQKVQRSGRTIIGIGVRETSSPYWVRCCNEFKYYDTLSVDGDRAPDSAAQDEQNEVRALLLRALRSAKLQRGDDNVPKATLKSVMMRLDPSFDEARFGFNSFTEFVEAYADIVEHIPNESGGMVRERTAAAPGARVQVPAVPTDVAIGTKPKAPSPTTSSPQGDEAPPSVIRRELVSKTRTGQTYEVILRRGSVLPMPAQWRQRALTHLQQLFDDAPEQRLPSIDSMGDVLARTLETSGLDADKPRIERLRGNLLSLRMLKFHGPNGVGLHPQAQEGRLARAVEEEMALRIVQQAALPVDLVGFTEVLYGTISARAMNDAETLLKKAAPEAAVAMEHASLIEHFGVPGTDSVGEIRHAMSGPKKPLRTLDLQSRFKVVPLLLIKSRGTRVAPGAEEDFEDGDVLVVLGKTEDVQRLEAAGPI